MSDRRQSPRIATATVIMNALVMYWARLGSLHALEMSGHGKWRKARKCKVAPSADTVGRVAALTDAELLRTALRHLYTRLKRNKALLGIDGHGVAVLDGHELHASYLRHCPGCLQRVIHTEGGDRIQYYHRNVTVMLLGGKVRLLLDQEPQRPGEDEVATALRLLERVFKFYPRAFEVVLADGLYAQARFFNFLLAHRKHAVAVLKDERRELYADACSLFAITPPEHGTYRSRECTWWDVQDLTSWPQVDCPVRVVRSVEKSSVRRQASKTVESATSEWIWVTTLPVARVGTSRLVQLGHLRWDIENFGFNELANQWYADHIYKHDPNAIEAFLLMAFLAYNIFHAFVACNLKRTLRYGKTNRYFSDLMRAQLYKAPALFIAGAPP